MISHCHLPAMSFNSRVTSTGVHSMKYQVNIIVTAKHGGNICVYETVMLLCTIRVNIV